MPPIKKATARTTAKKDRALEAAARWHKDRHVALSKRDAEIVRARAAGATWKEITDNVGCALRTAQMAVERAAS